MTRRARFSSVRSVAPLVALAFALVGLAATTPWSAGAPSIEATPSGTLFVADLRGHALIEVDLETRAQRRIELPGGPHELLALPDGRVVASLEQAGALAIIDRTSGEVTVLETGGLPHGLAQFDGDLLVTDRAVNATRRFALEDWREQHTLEGGTTPHAVAAGPDYVAVASAGDDTVRVGDAAWPVSALPETVAISPDGQRMAVAGAFGGGVHIFTSSGAPLAQLDLGGRPVRVIFAPDGRTLAVALSAAGQVAIIDTEGEALRLAVGGVPDGLAFDVTGRWLFASDIAGSAVSAIDLARGGVAWRIEVGESAGALLLVP